MTDLRKMVDTVRNFPGVTRKNAIHEVVDRFPTYGFSKVIAAEGEDAAVLECGDTCVLFAADGIMEKLMRADPYLAGYFAVLVNVNDIAAMGGRPLGMVDVMSFREGEIGCELLRGLRAGVKKFNVPLVGGHTHPDCNYDSIDISIIGSVKKEDVLLSSTAEDGDDIVFVIDLEGRFPDSVPYTYDSTSFKSEELVQAQMEAVCKVAEGHLAHACKDMSNPGHVGTLAMMLESSDMGGTVDVTRIPIPDGVDEYRWATTYYGCAFVFACPSENSQRIIDIFSDVGCTGAVVGKVDPTGKLKLTDGKDTEVLFDFSKDIITGVKVKR
ncbi:MAG: methanogenesis marker 2 protein [Thermoplasmata archaeon]|nr:methanogenesis marker 2 protein [Thermoplasmata archaeon]